MRINHAIRIAAGVAALALTVTACGGSSNKTASQHAADGKLTIGIKYDQPGLGLQNKDGSYSGFDVDVAKFVADKLGVKPENITFKESPSAQRETLIQNGQVDFIVATYSITDARKQKVDFAGPYFITGQSLLVRSDNTDITGPESLNGNKKLCSVKGSTPAQNIKDKYVSAKEVQLQEYDTYSLCVEALKSGAVDAVTTDDIILRGYAAQSPGALKVVGNTFTTEKYGIGVKKGDTESRGKINDAIDAMISSGAWKAALEKEFGSTGIQIPEPPKVDRY
ncbi:glutamate ABC transporter substrate-binding protein [Nocardia yunnanensis]|uniref:Glutamate ABC transporter substrate-binding protein n=1 Tax=Nocardia yunnanensis TaxID=2382165 RepID=A0A386ZBJ3_9NOCA|nr:glutamate ABC transporter substrate-binding protein [Nocardia yunnanensis]AYF74866.1 glutamate ABC transporter substrate-binding protein [Nocardia yunnanensis]